MKGPNGWRQVPTSFHAGEEEKALALLARVRDRLVAGEGLDGLLGPVTVRRWSKRWLEMRKGVVEDDGSDESVLRLHVLTHFGDMELGEVKPRHVAALVRSWMTEDYAPRTIRNVYYTMKSMFRDAAVEGLIDVTPCILGRAQLPRIVDADPEWRATAQYTRDEVLALISDPRLPEHERVANALLALAGVRVGEMGGLRVRNLTLDMLPLGRICSTASSLRMRHERVNHVRDKHVTSLATGAGRIITSVTAGSPGTKSASCA